MTSPDATATHPLRRRTLLLAGAAGLASAAGQAGAQSGAPIRIVVGYPAGATSDALARVLAEAMARDLGQPVIVENKVGAGGRIGNEFVKNAPPDGLTLLMTPVATMSIFASSYAGQLRYDPFKDFAPVAHLSNFQVGLGVGPQVPANTLAEYVAWVRSDPAKNGFYGSAASGSLPHFFGVMFGKSAGIELTHVPYKGTADAMQALAGGQIAALSTVAADLQMLVDAKKARLLAVAGERRSPAFASVPTFREQGFNLTALPWYGLFAPAGTPPDAIARLSRSAVGVVQSKALQERMVGMGLEPTGEGPERLAAVMKADYERWAPAIRASGFKPND